MDCRKGNLACPMIPSTLVFFHLELHIFTSAIAPQLSWFSGFSIRAQAVPGQGLALRPPNEKGSFRTPDLVELAPLAPSIHLDIRYATAHDFLGTAVYTEARAFLERPAAQALLRVQQKLKPLGYGLLILDAYRPWYVTKIFWDATPPEGKIFVADPAQGSRHNRGCADRKS